MRFHASSLVLAFAVSGLTVSGCQLPIRGPMPPIDGGPSLDAKAIIALDNGIYTAGLAKIPGTVCVPNQQGLCDAAHIYATQNLKAGATISVTPETDTAPRYDGLIDSKYKTARKDDDDKKDKDDAKGKTDTKFTDYKSAPFQSPAASDDELKEYRAYVVEKAEIAAGPNDGGGNGFPGADAIVASLEKEHHVTLKAGTVIYWITGAELITVTEEKFTAVPDMYEVVGIGFGGADATYNAREAPKQTAWIGIHAVKTTLSLPAEPAAPDGKHPAAPALVATPPQPVQEQIFDLDDAGKIKSGAGASK